MAGTVDTHGVILDITILGTTVAHPTTMEDIITGMAMVVVDTTPTTIGVADTMQEATIAGTEIDTDQVEIGIVGRYNIAEAIDTNERPRAQEIE